MNKVYWIVVVLPILILGCGQAQNKDSKAVPVSAKQQSPPGAAKEVKTAEDWPPPAPTKPADPIGSGGPPVPMPEAEPSVEIATDVKQPKVGPAPNRPLTSPKIKVTPKITDANGTEVPTLEPNLDDTNSKKVSVYFGTNRTPRIPPSGEDTLEDYYTSRMGKLQYGTCVVSVPRNRKAGELPTATKENRDRSSVFVLQSVEVAQNGVEWIADVADATRNGDVDRHDALVFVHGFNVSFADAVYRAAQLKEDLKFTGPALTFSWPSRGTVGGYNDDQISAGKSVADFESFLRLVLKSSQARKVHVVAHSMGNRVMTAAVANIAVAPDVGGSPIEEIILCAPDIDAKVFHEKIAPRFIKAGRRRTLYASKGDMALRASYFLHELAPRLGDGVEHVKGLPIEAIDAKLADTSLLAHSYYGDKPLVIEDIRAVLSGKAPDDRNLVRMYDNIWSFKLADSSDWWWFLIFAAFVVGILGGFVVRGFFSRK